MHSNKLVDLNVLYNRKTVLLYSIRGLCSGGFIIVWIVFSNEKLCFDYIYVSILH